MKKIISAILTIVMTITVLIQPVNHEVQAATKYISIKTFVQYLVVAMNLPLDKDFPEPYSAAALSAKILSGDDFGRFGSDLEVSITRTGAAVLLNRADEYLHGDTVDAELLKVVLEKRISDIKKVPEAKREAVAKFFAKGIFQGEFNGYYILNRSFKGTKKLTITEAKALISKVMKPSTRAKVSENGLLIRTTKLPNNDYMFPYILASFPNSYYEAKLRFEGVERRVEGKKVKLKSPEDYTYPVDVTKAKFTGINDFNDAREKYMDMWMNKVYTRVWNTFNVNYKTIDDSWIETIAQTDNYVYENSNKLYRLLNEYIKEMKENKTIVECDEVVMDSSSMYYYNGAYYVRCYVHYRIKSSNIKKAYTVDEFFKNYNEYWGPYNRVLFCRTSDIFLNNYKLSKWEDVVFDVGINTGVDGNDGSMFGVSYCDWTPELFRAIERD